MAGGDTHERILDAALSSFGTKGYDATSLDQLASELGIAKQTILYYHHTKADLLAAVVDRAAAEVAAALEAAVTTPREGFARVEALVKAVFRVALRRPEVLGLLREAGRLGPESNERLTAPLTPLLERAQQWLASEMDAGRLRRSDPQMLLLSVYASVTGVATEAEVAEALGMAPTVRSMALRRRELIRFLRAAMVPDGAEPDGAELEGSSNGDVSGR